MTEPQEDNICVAVRIRPINDRERKQNAKPILTIDETNSQKLWIDAKPEPKPFIFDNLIDCSIGQDEIFELIGKPQAQFCLKGYNASIFAYGQTGAGKTYTMLGKTGEARGLQPRVFEYIFDELSKFESSRVKCSYLEIYNEQIIDLLSISGTTLLVREDQKKGVYIEGLSEERVTNAEQAIELLNTGARNRHVSSTQMNFESSRSHSLFSLTIETKERVESGEVEKVKCSKFHFVDLAGSERQNLTAAAGQTLKEASNINKSLTVLGCVINSLVEQSAGKTRHIPYRDSKLTFILKDSLGGNSKTCIISAVSDASISFQETLSTLKFAQRAKMIKNKAKLNEENMVTDVRLLRIEIRQLKDKMDQMREHEALLERTVREVRAAAASDSKNGGDHSHHSEELEVLRQQIEIINAECQRNEIEFATGIELLNAHHQTEISKYEVALNEMTSELQKSFKPEIQMQLINSAQQMKIKQILGGLSINADDSSPMSSGIKVSSFMAENQTQKLLDQLNKNLPLGQSIEIEEDQMQIEESSRKSFTHPSQQGGESSYQKSINQLISKINESVQSRQQFQQTITKIGLEGSSDRMRLREGSVQSLRDEYNSQLENLQRQLHESRESKQQLSRDYQKAQSQLTSAQSEVAAKEAEIKSMEAMYMEICSTMHEESEQKSTKRILELEEKVIVMAQETAHLKGENIRLNDVISQTDKERNQNDKTYQQLHQAYEASESKRLILEQELKVQTQRIQELEAKEATSQSRISTLSMELETFISQSAEMLEEANKFARIELANETLSSSNEALTAFNERLSLENTKLTDQIDTLNTSNTFLQTRIDDLLVLSTENEKLQRDNIDLAKKCTRLTEQYEGLQADLTNMRANTQDNSEALVDQNKALYRRIDEYVVEIDTFTKEANNLKSQIARKQEQITKIAQKNNDFLTSQKQFQAAHKEITDKLILSQQRVSHLKEKLKARKESSKSNAINTELEAKLRLKEEEIVHLNALLEERTNRCNDVCLRLNELLDDKEKGKRTNQSDSMQQQQSQQLQNNNNSSSKEIQLQLQLQDAQTRIIETNSSLQKEKLTILSKLSKVEADKEELMLKHKGLEETFNNLIVQYSLLKGEHNQLLLITKNNGNINPHINAQVNMQAKGINNLQTEVQMKADKINDLQNYLDKYAIQIRQLDAENMKANKDLEATKRNVVTQSAVIAESEKRIDDLVDIIGEFEMQCGAASNLIENLTQEHEDNLQQLASLRETTLSTAATIAQARQPMSDIANQKDYDLLKLRDAKLSRKLKKYKMKFILLKKKYKSQVESSGSSGLRAKLLEKEKSKQRFQDLGDDLNEKLVQANKKIAQQMEHIQFQLKCYEEDKKHTRIEADRTIKSLQTQLDEKTKQLTAKALRMSYFENLNQQITESLDKNNSIYTQNVAVIKEKDRRITYAQKLHCEIHNQLSAVVNRKAFFKPSDESLRLALLRILDFIENRSLEPISEQNCNKENQDTANTRHNSRRELAGIPTMIGGPLESELKPIDLLAPIGMSAGPTTIVPQISKHGQHSQAYSHLNVNSAVIAKDIEDFDRKLEKEFKHTGQFVLSPILEKEAVQTHAITPVTTLFTAPTAPHGSKHHSKHGHHHHRSSQSQNLFATDLKVGSSKLPTSQQQQFQTAKKLSPVRQESNHTKTLHRYLDESIANIFAETGFPNPLPHPHPNRQDGDLLRKKMKL